MSFFPPIGIADPLYTGHLGTCPFGYLFVTIERTQKRLGFFSKSTIQGIGIHTLFRGIFLFVGTF